MAERFLPGQVERSAAAAVRYEPQPTVYALILLDIAIRVARVRLRNRDALRVSAPTVPLRHNGAEVVTPTWSVVAAHAADSCTPRCAKACSHACATEARSYRFCTSQDRPQVRQVYSSTSVFSYSQPAT